MRIISSFYRKELTVHWSAPQSLIKPFLWPCTNTVWGMKGAMAFIKQDCGCQKGEDFLSGSSHNFPETCGQQYYGQQLGVWAPASKYNPIDTALYEATSIQRYRQNVGQSSSKHWLKCRLQITRRTHLTKWGDWSPRVMKSWSLTVNYVYWGVSLMGS